MLHRRRRNQFSSLSREPSVLTSAQPLVWQFADPLIAPRTDASVSVDPSENDVSTDPAWVPVNSHRTRLMIKSLTNLSGPAFKCLAFGVRKCTAGCKMADKISRSDSPSQMGLFDPSVNICCFEEASDEAVDWKVTVERVAEDRKVVQDFGERQEPEAGTFSERGFSLSETK